MTYLTIPDELDKLFEALSAKGGISKVEYALYVLKEFLEEQEDYLHALESALRIERGEEETVPFEEVVKKLGLEKEA
ncbi:MAG: hypothetical protein JSR85_06555 [Proteobacteria bacterium]|nr:hypothetical protein [Pseudomonadota bacterium]